MQSRASFPNQGGAICRSCQITLLIRAASQCQWQSLLWCAMHPKIVAQALCNLQMRHVNAPLLQSRFDKLQH